MRASRWFWIPLVVVGVASGLGGCRSDRSGGTGSGGAQGGTASAEEQQKKEELGPEVTVDTQKIDVPHSTIDTTEEVDPSATGQ